MAKGVTERTAAARLLLPLFGIHRERGHDDTTQGTRFCSAGVITIEA